MVRYDCNVDAWVRQLQHLINCATHPNILIQIAPTDAGSHRGLNGPFLILDYGDDTKLVHLENKTINLFLDKEEEIEEYAQTWAELQELSPTNESKLHQRLRKGFEATLTDSDWHMRRWTL